MTFATDPISFNIQLVNPCLDATIEAGSFTPTSLTVDYGTSASAAYPVPNDTVDTATGLAAGTYCGPRVYTVVDDSDESALAWASVDATTTPGSVTVTVDAGQYPTVPTADVTVTLRVTTTYETWTLNPGKLRLLLRTRSSIPQRYVDNNHLCMR